MGGGLGSEGTSSAQTQALFPSNATYYFCMQRCLVYVVAVFFIVAGPAHIRQGSMHRPDRGEPANEIRQEQSTRLSSLIL